MHEENHSFLVRALRLAPEALPAVEDHALICHARGFGGCGVDLIVDGSFDERVGFARELGRERLEELSEGAGFLAGSHDKNTWLRFVLTNAVAAADKVL